MQKKEGGAILLVGAGISVSAGIPPAQKLMQIAIENFPDYFTKEEKQLLKEEPSKLQYNDIMTKLSASQRKTLFNWHIKGDEKNNIPKAKLNFAHLAIAELLKQKYIKRILTTNFDPLLINACYMVGMYPLPSIYDLGSVNQINPELFDDPCIIYLNGQHAGQVQRNTPSQLTQHKFILSKVIHSTGCKRPWIIAGYSGENDPLMEALDELRPYNN
ncbi:MAG: SIR2 family NAD-dependent protein deacylase [Acinetobacter johnsonii]